jgi:homopolymeric O-antigen transport system permease protein
VQPEPVLVPDIRPPAATSVRRIEPSHGLIPIDVSEIWRYRELLGHLLVRDVKTRYKQTFLGPVWAILRPLVSMVLMSAVFGGLAGFTSGEPNIPYPLFLYSGMLIWMYFQSALPAAASGLLANAGLLGKAYFPRLYAPLSAVSTPIADFAFSFIVLFGLFGYFQVWPSWHIVFLPFFLVLAILTCLGVGLWLCGISVRYRDVPFVLPFIVQLWFYVTPVIYPISKVPEPYRSLLVFNPMSAVVEGFRWSLLGITAPDMGVVVGSTVFSIVLLVAGLFVFRRTERTIVDMM